MDQGIAHAGRRQKVAIIGTGISGLSAAWMLRDTADITVYEQNAHVGGHTRTIDVETRDGVVPVDMGFIVYNEHTYPNLTALFEHLGVATQTTDMSLAVSLDGGRLEYAGGYLSQLFAQKRNLLRPRFWRMINDLVRFYRTAPNDLEALSASGMTLGAYLDEKRYGAAFQQDHLLPMAAAIWSMPATDVRGYPAHAFIRFQENHGLLKLTDRPLWRTVTGGSQAYVRNLTSSFRDRIRVDAGVRSIERTPRGVLVHTGAAEAEVYDQVVIAAHANQALAMLSAPTPAERRLLGAFRYTPNYAVLHSDDRFMPVRRRAWASWNYIGQTRKSVAENLTVTYWMNQLQALPTQEQLFVTLNPGEEVDAAKIHQAETFEHPVIDTAAINAQQELWSLQGEGGVWFCGAHFGAGFHEDGLQAGLAVAEAISGRKRPWRVANESGRIVVGPAPRVRVSEGVAA